MCPVHGTCTVCPPAQTALNPQMRVTLCAVMCTSHPQCAAHCNPPSAAPCALCRTLHRPQHCLAPHPAPHQPQHPAPCTGHGTEHGTLHCAHLYHTAIGVGDVCVAVAITPRPQGGGYRGWGHAAPSSPMAQVGLPPPTGVVQARGAVQGRGRLCVFPCALQRKWPRGHFVQLGGSVGAPAPPQESPGADSNGDVVTVRMRATHVASRLRYVPQGPAQGRGWLRAAGSPWLGGPGGTLAQQAAMAPTTGTRCWARGWGHACRRRGFTLEAAGYST